MSHPLLLSIEGIDGSGKTTQVTRLAAALSEAGVRAEPMVVEAFGARTVNTLSEQLTGDPYAYHPTIPVELREWVFACDVAYFTKTRFPPLLDAGVTVVWDRGPLSYHASAVVYDGLSEWVRRAQSLYPRPHRTYLLDLPAETAVRRLTERAGKRQRTDESLNLLRRVRELMLEMAEDRPDVVVLDATRDPDETTDQILRHWLTSRPDTD
ncbi:dTMP kinase [Streptomyces alanosinicus]|uniref:Thymidylate kinase n=1 Tax=Streptomyces alanosinicus TaxID=68171 RepID=A0A918YLL4_9ACTN|nr:AAA family ATPase [Streptomyces alanosinicus]GHE07314.1 thymidylate kinase [Streptomyces alanosinicus]